MSKILVLSGENHGFSASASIIHDFLSEDADISATLTDDKGILASAELNTYDACVFGTGFHAYRASSGRAPSPVSPI